MAALTSAQIVSRDIDADFIVTTVVTLGWEYQLLHDRISEGSAVPASLQEEEFRKARSFSAVRALTHACRKHGVPSETRRLACNGQEKLLVRIGRVVLIQEPIFGHADGPSIADYKLDLADMHGFVRQLELPLNESNRRSVDWSGCVLAVLLHGPSGDGLSLASAALKNVYLAIPDAAYQQWVHRFDLHNVAMFGGEKEELDETKHESSSEQADNVVITPKKKKQNKRTGLA